MCALIHRSVVFPMLAKSLIIGLLSGLKVLRHDCYLKFTAIFGLSTSLASCTLLLSSLYVADRQRAGVHTPVNGGITQVEDSDGYILSPVFLTVVCFTF